MKPPICKHTVCPIVHRAEGEERRNVLKWMGINWWGHATINHVVKKLNRQRNVLKDKQ